MQIVATSLDYTKANLDAICALGSSQDKNGQIVIPIGKNSEGIVFENFSSIPNSLIVGTTGSGKSTFVRTAIIEMMNKYTPDQVRFAIYDSRRVDYSFLNNNPFMLFPVCSELSKITDLVQWSLTEARERLNNLGQLDGYPHIFIILDDFSEASPSIDTFANLIQLFQISRRVKIHFWLVTSTPTSNVLPTNLKPIIIHRIAFRVASKSISRIVLDEVGAETLNAPGEIIAKYNNEIVKCESVFLEDADIEDYSIIAAQKYPEPRELLSLDRFSASGDTNSADPFIGEDGKDVLYAQAVEVILDSKQVSSTIIQRRLRIGYSRAVHLIDQMEKDGIVGSLEGSKIRMLLITREQWESFQNGVSSNSKGRAANTNQVELTRVSTKNTELPDLTNKIIVLGSGYIIRTIGSEITVCYKNSEVTITRSSITELLFKRSGLLRKGNLTIHFSTPASADNPKSVLRAIDIPFVAKDANSIKSFCRQLAMDIKKPFVEF